MAANDNRPAGKRAKPARTEKTCPICGRPRDPAFAPFCSRRCADVDLHRWLKGAYVIPGSRAPETEGGEGD